MAQVIVTGAESFIGKRLLNLLDARNIPYIGIDLVQSTRKNVFQGSIQSKELTHIIPDNPDAIIHLAALSRDPDCRNQGYKCFDINVLGSLNLIDIAEKKKAKQFIFASTEWVYDNFVPGQPNDENTEICPARLKSEYAFSKFVTEVNLRQKFNHGFCPTTILRFGIIYGPRKANWSAVESLFYSVKQSNEINISSRQTGRCFVHVDDIVEAIVLSLGLSGFEIINIQNDRLITLGDILDTSQRLFKKKIKIIETDPNHPSVRLISNFKAKNLLRWSPKLGLEAGLQSLEPEYFNA